MDEDPDLTDAWWCAANLRLYDEDPGSRAVNVATAEEPRWVDRHEALVELYARRLLLQCDADPARIAAAGAGCRERALRERRWWSGRGPDPIAGQGWWHRFAGRLPWTGLDLARTWCDAALICEVAAGWLDAAGAAEDPRARARMPAVHRHRLQADVLGSWLPPDVQQVQAVELAEDLDALDEDRPDDGGPTHCRKS